MKRTAIALSVGLVAGLPAAALAQAGHDTHHPAQAQEQAAPPAAPTMPMPGMPDQMRTMMQAMPAECMSAMQQMMQGGMMHGAVDASKAAGMVPADGNVFVTNIADDSVSVIDLARQQVVGSVPVGDRPNGIVYGP